MFFKRVITHQSHFLAVELAVHAGSHCFFVLVEVPEADVVQTTVPILLYLDIRTVFSHWCHTCVDISGSNLSVFGSRSINVQHTVRVELYAVGHAVGRYRHMVPVVV